MPELTVALDAGHGGSDPGATYQGRQEKDDTLRLVKAVGAILENNGINVVYTRTNDIYETPFKKASDGNNSGADFFISIHRNSSETPNQYSGAETLVYSDDGVRAIMARNINDELSKAGFRNLGVDERPNLVVLKRTQMPAALVEVGFINSEEDNRIFDENFTQIAQGIANGIIKTLYSQNVAYNEFTKQTDSDVLDSNTLDSAGVSSSLSASDYRNDEDEEDDYSYNNYYSNNPNNADNPDYTTIPGSEQMPGNLRMPNMNDSPFPSDYNMPGSPQNFNTPENFNIPQNFNTPENFNIPRSNIPRGNMPQAYNDQPPYNNRMRNNMQDTFNDPIESFYRVQVGAYQNKNNADRLLNSLLIEGFPAFIIYDNGYHKVQVGVFRNLANAIKMEHRLRRFNYNTYIAYY